MAISLLTLVTSCSLFDRKKAAISYAPGQEVFHADFDQVWRATQIALQNYPMRINNMDKGIIETGDVRGYQVWTPPNKPNAKSGGLRYRISVTVVKGNLKGKSAVKVTVSKNMTLKRDFFSTEEKVVSDGLEEKTILYRIERELEIDRALRRAQQQMSGF